MRHLCVLFFGVLLFGCQHRGGESATVANAQPVVARAGKTTGRKWIEYKKVPVFSASDTLPYPNCYIIIKKDSFFYYRYGKLFEKQLLLVDKRYVDTVYTFKRKPGDLLIFNGKQQENCLLKRDYFEGEYEYFKLAGAVAGKAVGRP